MSSDQDRVIVSPSDAAGGGFFVHHREFPEIQGEGADPMDAAHQLLNHLVRALDSALTKWRRDAIESAIAEVKMFTHASS